MSPHPRLAAAPWLALTAALGVGCAAFVPLRDPPLLTAEDPLRGATTRDEVVARLGPPAEVRASDVGTVLVYRRPRVVSGDPSRYYGEDRGTRLERYERVLVLLDAAGRVVRWGVEPE